MIIFQNARKVSRIFLTTTLGLIIFLTVLLPKQVQATPATVSIASSFWFTPIPVNAQLDPNSDNYVNEFLRQLNTYYGTVNINTSSWSSAVYVVNSSVPTVTVNQWDCQNKGVIDPGLAVQWAAVPVPDYTLIPPDADAEVVVYQPATNTFWEFWKMQNVNGNWQACWGGQLNNIFASNGIMPFPYGATATGLPLLGGQITASDLQNGKINHVIGISLADLADQSIVSWPANRSDGYNPNNLPNRIPAGTRFRLDPTINVNALNIHPVAKIIAKAAQAFGFVVWDKASSIAIRAQNAVSYTALGMPNPYPSLFAGTPNYLIMKGFPWGALQFMPMNYGQQ